MTTKSSVQYVKSYKYGDDNLESVTVDSTGRLTVETSAGESFTLDVDNHYWRLFAEIVAGHSLVKERTDY